jgi:NADPH-dependent curcumin reductase CurA
VIGIAGTDEKCRWVEKLGADVCVNYKSSSFRQELTKETEGFVEIYFGESFAESMEAWKLTLSRDNVGGEILDFMLTRLAMFGRVAAR